MNELGPFTSWELLALILVVALTLGVTGVWLTHRWLRPEVRADPQGVRGPIWRQDDVVGRVFGLVATVYAVFLGFTVVAVWEQFDAAKHVAASEASTLTTMYRQTAAMPNPERSELRALLRQYTEAVIGPEWRAQRSGGTSPLARADITKMYATLARQRPQAGPSPVDQEFLSQTSALASDRNARTLASQDHVPWILWVALILGGLVAIGLSCTLYMERFWLHATLCSTAAVLIGLLLFNIAVLNRPFGGSLGIQPDSFQHAVSVFTAVDREAP